MTKNKTTKRALLSSVMALFICFAMLLGTTYAWFTDSVTSANNIIQSGTLKIDLLHKVGEDWISVKEKPTHQIFNYEKWEPGYTQVETLTIVNKGTLALKYMLTLDAEGAVNATTGEKLSDVIDVYVCEGVSTAQSAADLASAAWNKLGTLTDVLAKDAVVSGNLLPAGETATTNDEVVGERIFTIALHMQESAGNVYQNLSVGNLSVNLIATQYTYEKDSFDNKYDEEAEYPIIYDHVVSTLDELEKAFAEGGNVLLSEGVKMDNMIRIAEGVEVYLDMNGQTITFEREAAFKPGNPLFYPLPGSKLTITGNGTVDLGNNFDAALVYPAGEVIIENGTFVRNRVPDGTDPDEVQTLFMGVKSVGASVVINGGYFDGGYYDANANKVFDETDVDITNRGQAADKNAYRTAIKNNVSLLINLSWSSAAGTQDFRIYGGTFVGANPAWGDEGCALPITPDYLRPWSYYQGTFLDGQQMYDDRIEIPANYTITESTTADGRPVYTVDFAYEEVATADDVKNAITSGKSVVLTDDIVITETLDVKTFTKIDLNGKSLTVSRLEASAELTINGGTLVNGEATYPAISVNDGGKLVLNDVTVLGGTPCNIITSGTAQAAEIVGVQVFGGECVLNNSTIVVNVTEVRYSNSVFAIGIHGGSLTMNGGSISVTSVGSAKEKYDYQSAIFAGGDTNKTVTLNDVDVEAKNILYAWGGNTTLNTTDPAGTWVDSQFNKRNGGDYTVNYDYAG